MSKPTSNKLGFIKKFFEKTNKRDDVEPTITDAVKNKFKPKREKIEDKTVRKAITHKLNKYKNIAKNALINTGTNLLNTANKATNLIGFNNQDGNVKNPDDITDKDLNVLDLYGAKYKILIDDESDTVCVTQVNDDLINALKASNKNPNVGGKIIKKRRTRKIRKTRKKKKMGKK